MTTATREKPIPFTPENVRAIIDGRKTQTRRVVKPQPSADIDTFLPADPSGFWGFVGESPTQCIHCPYGEVGDKLWVREAWGITAAETRPPFTRDQFLTGEYDLLRRDIRLNFHYKADGDKLPRYRHAMYMPRVASRLTLEITGIRVERVTDISASDCRAEGISLAEEPEPLQQAFAIAEYRHLWESINGPGSWAANQYVWAISFRRIEHAS